MPRKDSHILIVEDDLEVAGLLRYHLMLNNYKCHIVNTGEGALAFLASHQIDLMLLDLLLIPGMSGLEVCEKIRAHSFQPPIIVISAVYVQDQDIVKAFDLGADDYVIKPFNMDVLLRRIRVVLRRTDLLSEAAQEEIVTGQLRINFTQELVQLHGEDVKLSPIEYALLEVLVKNRGRVVTKKMLLSKVWGDSDRAASEYLHVYINHLRRKIEPDPRHPRFIRTERSFGYRFTLEEQ